jgi:uncharacterized protein YegJ (DUF2314 family)
VVGVETLLDCDKTLDEYVALLRMLATLPSPAVLDMTTMQWHCGHELLDLISSPPAEPRPEILWTIHAVGDHAGNERGTRWLHTHGLWRCGLPELEMLEVPQAFAAGGASLLNEIATFALEIGLPPPGKPFFIGPGLEMLLQPWEPVAEQVAAPHSGGLDDREGDDDSHRGVRAVVCGTKPGAGLRHRWMWPERAVNGLANGDSSVFRTESAATRQAQLARDRWDEFALAFEALRRSSRADHKQAEFMVKAVVSAESADPDSREHLWFDVQGFDGARARGRLVSTPSTVPTPKVGAVIPVAREMVSDWSVRLPPRGAFGPNDVPALRRAVTFLAELRS